MPVEWDSPYFLKHRYGYFKQYGGKIEFKEREKKSLYVSKT